MTGLEPFFLMAATAATAVSEIAASNTESAIAEANAKAMERRANEDRAVSQHQAEEQRKKTKSLISQQQAAYAASGGGTGGSASEVIGSTAGQGEYNAELELWQGEQKARGLDDQASLERFAAKQKRKALPLKIGATVLTGASKVAGSWGGGGDPFGSASSSSFRYG